MFNTNVKKHKVYIKKSLSQTIVLDLATDKIEPSFEESSRFSEKEEEIRDFGKNKVEEKV